MNIKLLLNLMKLGQAYRLHYTVFSIYNESLAENTSIFAFTSISPAVSYFVFQCNLYFDEFFQETIMQEYYVYTLSSLFAETGGYLGLYLGASLLTIWEFISDMFPKIFRIILRK